MFFICLLCVSCGTKARSNSGVETAMTKDPTKGIIAVAEPRFRLFSVMLDEQDRKIMEKTSPRTVDRMDHSEPLTVSDIIKLSQGGVSDEVIVKYLRETNTVYNLSQAQVKKLHQGGVSQRIINYMVGTGN